jgi:hypothetical protein
MVGGDARRSVTEVVIATKSFSRACDHAQAGGSALFSRNECRLVNSLPYTPLFTDTQLWKRGFRSWPPICRAGISERLPVKSSCAKLNVKLTISVDSVEIRASICSLIVEAEADRYGLPRNVWAARRSS